MVVFPNQTVGIKNTGIDANWKPSENMVGIGK